MSARLNLALTGGGLALPDAGRLAVFHPRGGTDLSMLPRARTVVIQPMRPDHDVFSGAGYSCRTNIATDPARYDAALIFLPRAKAQARALIAEAAAISDGLVIVDGAKTDGIDSVMREVKKRAALLGTVAKAHGKLFWFSADAASWSDWAAQPTRIAQGFVTTPGVFSADGIDPASAMLAAHLPEKIGRNVADLGAGWGYLSSQLLKRDGVNRVHLVEADQSALQCAQLNIVDRRAQFHWADATTWQPDEPVNAVVMNPPFHTERRAEPALGQAFIASAAAMLVPGGQLWMVANRHLPYETALNDVFARVEECSGDARFKILHALRPTRSRR